MDSPPELLPYLSTNFPLPHGLKATLGSYLTQTSSSITGVYAEIDRLERAIDVQRQKAERYKKGYEDHFKLQASIRSVPPEIWGIIFGFPLGDQPFRRWEYRTYGYLRGVCTTWRDVAATTPDICRGLVVDADGPLIQTSCSDEKGMRRGNLDPWLAIVSWNHPYHLVLGAEDNEAIADFEDDVAKICEWIFTTVPTPTILSIQHADVFSWVCAYAPHNTQISHLTLDFDADLDREELEETLLEDIFPCLKNLVINAPISFPIDLSHTGIQSLRLTNICSFAEEFARFLLDLPSLRELRIDSRDRCRPSTNTPDPNTPLIHPMLEILVADGEDLLLLLENITFPSLKYFGLNAWGSSHDYEILLELIPAFFQRCALDNKNFTVSVRGRPSQFIFDLILHSIPCSSRLHLGMDKGLGGEDDEVETPAIPAPTHARTFTEVFSSVRLYNGDWLRGRGGSPGSGPTKLFTPKGVLRKEPEGVVEMYRADLLHLGYELQVLPWHDYEALLRASIPQTTLDWEAWRLRRPLEYDIERRQRVLRV
ncbi:hypothetical protein BKA70DRAFT_1466601 [Coprinopsis sp. MPI-PUGE-AT-0042]|nr:hypothetical protein BKA70DRAFT_1466601 [Coprinopsis sp. MPI-PUGE-AT-0042]